MERLIISFSTFYFFFIFEILSVLNRLDCLYLCVLCLFNTGGAVLYTAVTASQDSTPLCAIFIKLNGSTTKT